MADVVTLWYLLWLCVLGHTHLCCELLLSVRVGGRQAYAEG
jgi:hypothetical protein